MSRAFVKETDGSEGEELPELAISPHRNLVTARGLELIEATVKRLDAELAAARAADDPPSVKRIERDRRYWASRRASAELVAPVVNPATVRFGCRVALATESGERRSFCIVGEDESDPARGLVSYVSPFAQALMGAAAGDTVPFRNGRAEIVAIE
jgi:transcription elongation GreA/GreB family factor